MPFLGLQHCVGTAVQHDKRAEVRDKIRHSQRATVQHRQRKRVQHRPRTTMQHCERAGQFLILILIFFEVNLVKSTSFQKEFQPNICPF